jgi:L-lactate dehydrogenase complex protein LldG
MFCCFKAVLLLKNIMAIMSSKEKILSRISEALKTKSDLRETDKSVDDKIKSSINMITPKDNESLWRQFKTEIEKISGEYYSFNNEEEAAAFIYNVLSELNINLVSSHGLPALKNIKEKLAGKGIKTSEALKLSAGARKKETAQINAAIVEPSFAVADIGSLVFVMEDAGTSYPYFLCDNTIAVVKKENIVANQFELFDKIEVEKSKNMFFVTGPSRTADIEKVLVLGAHGPRRLIVITIL